MSKVNPADIAWRLRGADCERLGRGVTEDADGSSNGDLDGVTRLTIVAAAVRNARVTDTVVYASFMTSNR